MRRVFALDIVPFAAPRARRARPTYSRRSRVASTRARVGSSCDVADRALPRWLRRDASSIHRPHFATRRALEARSRARVESARARYDARAAVRCVRASSRSSAMMIDADAPSRRRAHRRRRRRLTPRDVAGGVGAVLLSVWYATLRNAELTPSARALVVAVRRSTRARANANANANARRRR